MFIKYCNTRNLFLEKEANILVTLLICILCADDLFMNFVHVHIKCTRYKYQIPLSVSIHDIHSTYFYGFSPSINAFHMDLKPETGIRYKRFVFTVYFLVV